MKESVTADSFIIWDVGRTGFEPVAFWLWRKVISK